MFQIGDPVRKVKGYRWPGVVVAVFQTLEGQTRIVVECTVPEVAGALHIFNPEQLEADQTTKFNWELAAKMTGRSVEELKAQAAASEPSRSLR